MKLFSNPFIRINNGEKEIEFRLNDEKRSDVKIGDIIRFKKYENLEEHIEVVVERKIYAISFRELFKSILNTKYGPSTLELESWVKAMNEIYSDQLEEKYGVVGLYFKVL